MTTAETRNILAHATALLASTNFDAGLILAAMFDALGGDDCPVCHGTLVTTVEAVQWCGDREIVTHVDEPCPCCVCPPEPSFVAELPL